MTEQQHIATAAAALDDPHATIPLVRREPMPDEWVPWHTNGYPSCDELTRKQNQLVSKRSEYLYGEHAYGCQ